MTFIFDLSHSLAPSAYKRVMSSQHIRVRAYCSYQFETLFLCLSSNVVALISTGFAWQLSRYRAWHRISHANPLYLGIFTTVNTRDPSSCQFSYGSAKGIRPDPWCLHFLLFIVICRSPDGLHLIERWFICAIYLPFRWQRLLLIQNSTILLVVDASSAPSLSLPRSAAM